MNLMIAMLVLVQQPEPPKPAAPVLQGQAEDLDSLQKKRLVKEAERHNLRSLVQEAKEKKDEKEAKRYAGELEAVEQDLVVLNAAIEEKRKEGAASWGKASRLEGRALLTRLVGAVRCTWRIRSTSGTGAGSRGTNWGTRARRCRPTSWACTSRGTRRRTRR
jgi:hypothetical protein